MFEPNSTCEESQWRFLRRRKYNQMCGLNTPPWLQSVCPWWGSEKVNTSAKTLRRKGQIQDTEEKERSGDPWVWKKERGISG
jgi:hypothetical protein